MISRPLTLVTLSAVLTLGFVQPASAGQFDYTDTSAVGSWTAPTGTSTVQVILQGAGGGSGASISGGTGGGGASGARIASSINVAVGETLDIDLGHTGTSSSSSSGTSAGGESGFTGAAGDGAVGGGGGGGGASVVKIGADTILISGGGGGGGGANGDTVGGASLVANPSGGAGGSAGTGYILLNGITTYSGSPGTVGSNMSTVAGGGATGAAGGSGGAFGGAGGASNAGGDGGSNFCGGGGGGGGYFGGGGGGGAAAFESSGCSGGGAGSSFMSGARTGTNRIYIDGATGYGGLAQVNYIDFTTTSLSDGEVGSSYSQGVVATFGAATSPDTWSVSPALPAGLTLNTSTGVITGTPTQAVNATYTITASYDPGGLGLIARSSTSLTLLIASAPTPSPSSSAGNSAGELIVAPDIRSQGGPWTLRVGDPTLLIPTVNSGSAARYSISPSLPAGMTLNEFTGIISGIPESATSNTNYLLTAVNAGGASTTTFTMEVTATDGLGASPVEGGASSSREMPMVTFARGSARLSAAAREILDATINQQGSRTLAPTRVVAMVPAGASEFAERSAYRRGVAVRRYLRENGLEVSSRIELRPASTRAELRGVSVHQP